VAILVNKQRLVNEFMELVKIDSISLHERKMADVLLEKLEAAGYHVQEDDTAIKIGGDTGNLICRIEGTKNVPEIMFMAHMDTTVPGMNKKPVIDGNIIRTDGTTILGADDIAGVACILEALKVIKENGMQHGNITVIFTVAEEIGLLGAKHLNFNDFMAKYCFVLDGAGAVGVVCVQAPYHKIMDIEVYGKAAHAGVEPEKGISAIKIASDAIASMEFGRIDSETTSNIGIIQGGIATNVVCDKVKIQAEVRSLDQLKLRNQVSYIDNCFQEAASKFKGKVLIQTSMQYPGFNITPEHSAIELLKTVCDKNSLELKLESTGGGSDTNIVNQSKICGINLSIGMTEVHSLHEHIDISDMVRLSNLVVGIIEAVK